jgi:hypothetical protein
VGGGAAMALRPRKGVAGASHSKNLRQSAGCILPGTPKIGRFGFFSAQKLTNLYRQIRICAANPACQLKQSPLTGSPAWVWHPCSVFERQRPLVSPHLLRAASSSGGGQAEPRV